MNVISASVCTIDAAIFPLADKSLIYLAALLKSMLVSSCKHKREIYVTMIFCLSNIYEARCWARSEYLQSEDETLQERSIS